MKPTLALIVLCVLGCRLQAQVSFKLSSSPGAGSDPNSVAAADVNGDGKPDLISANYYGNTLSVLTNNGSDGFVLSGTYSVGINPVVVVAADVNGDGKVDLVCANSDSGDSTLSVLTNNGSGGFVLSGTYPVGSGPVSVTAADVNGDGRVDLISPNEGSVGQGNTLTVLTNNGSGGFVFASTLTVGNSPFSVAAADVNGDGKMDLISANLGDNTLSVLTNDGSGGFVLAGTYVVGSQPRCVTAADVNRDGKVDLISANWGGGGGNTLTVLTNNGSGGFVFASTLTVGGGSIYVAAVDVNGDGKADLISANLYGNSLSVLTNNGSGGFVLATNLSVGINPNSVTAADVNGDGRVDLISPIGGNNTLSVLTNATPVIAPLITAQPASLLALAGTNAAFGVSLSSASFFRYQWQFNGTNILNATNATYAIASVATNNAGNYSLIVTNLAGVAASSNAILAVITSPASLTNKAGSMATFAVSTFSPVPLGDQWQWRKNGTNLVDGSNLSGSANYTLTVANISDSDAGSYSVIVSNTIGTIRSSNATLVVVDPPLITVQPASLLVLAGTNAAFGVGLSGSASFFRYQWQFNGTNILNATNATYSIASVATNNAGNYSLIVTNLAGGVVSSNAILAVITSPTSLTNKAGSLATFAVSTFSPTPLGDQWQWQKNGTNLFDGGNLSGTTNNTLIIANISDSDAGFYSVIVSNAIGRIMSSNATLTVVDPPLITVQPASLLVLAGTNAAFGVSLSGSASFFRYQWQFNGTNIVNATNATYAIAPVATNNAGNYSLIVTNLAGVAASSNAILAAVTSPASLTNKVGSTATFAVSTFSPVSLGDQWQWQKNGTNLFDGGNIYGSTNNTLTVANISDSDAGFYSVIVSNAIGTIRSSNAMLTVVDPPLFTTQPTNQLALAGTNATFGVSLSGSASYFRYQWQFNGTNILNATNTTYAIASVATNNAGNYSLIVTNLAGVATSSNATLTVVLSPQSRTNYASSTATFSAITFGPELPNFQWQKNGTNLINGGNVSGSTNSMLTVANVQDVDAANYSAVVSNAHASVTTSNAVLTVNDTLIFATQPQSQTNLIGSTAVFNATAYGVPPFVFQWYLNGMPVGSPISGTNYSAYTITNVGTNQAGIYTVQVVNGSGSVTSSNAILTVAVPPVITTQPLNRTNNLNTTATFSVTASSVLPLSYQWQQNGTNLVNGGKFSGVTNGTLTITGVSSNEVALYTVMVTNMAGSVTSSNAVLLVVYPPVVTTQPSSLLVLPGTNVAFGFSLNGTAPFAYNWQFNGTNILSATNASYTILSVVTNSAGNYSVVITNPAGSITSSVAGLTVLLLPTNQVKAANSTATFSAPAFSPVAVAYQWQMNGTNLVNGGKFSGATNNTLTITGVSSNEAAVYAITVTNMAGSVTSSNATLTVIYPPIITAQPLGQRLILGNGVSFNVAVSGTAPFNYQWRYNAGNLLNATNAIYTIQAVDTNNTGNYSVVVTNLAGSVTSSNALLLVLVPPTLALQFAAGYPLLNLNGMLSNNFVVQYNTDLTTTNWINLLSLTNLLTSPYLFLDPAGVVPPARFYRAMMK